MTALYTWHTLGNTAVDGVLAKGGLSYGVTEFFSAGILVGYLWYLRGRLDEIRSRCLNSEKAQMLTAADFTIMVSNIPYRWATKEVRDYFENFGEVVHVGLSLNYRDLILAIQKGQGTATGAHGSESLELLRKMSNLAKKEEIFEARKRAKRTLDAVDANEKRIKQLMRNRYHCTGYAFVTFNSIMVAQLVVDEMTQRAKKNVRARVLYQFGGQRGVPRARA